MSQNYMRNPKIYWNIPYSRHFVQLFIIPSYLHHTHIIMFRNNHMYGNNNNIGKSIQSVKVNYWHYLIKFPLMPFIELSFDKIIFTSYFAYIHPFYAERLINHILHAFSPFSFSRAFIRTRVIISFKSLSKMTWKCQKFFCKSSFIWWKFEILYLFEF